MGVRQELLNKRIIRVDLTKDLDADRYLTWEQFIQFLKVFPMYSTYQMMFFIQGITGFRCDEVCQLTTANLLFDDRKNPRILNKIQKAKPQYRQGHNNIVYAVYKNKIIRRKIPLWTMAFILEFLYRNRHKLLRDENDELILFPNRAGTGPVKSTTVIAQLAKIRDRLFNSDLALWGWVKTPVHPRFWTQRGTVDYIFKLSTHAFRHSRLTWKAMEYAEQGWANSTELVSKWAGHDLAETTSCYISCIISEPFKAPDLNKNPFVQ